MAWSGPNDRRAGAAAGRLSGMEQRWKDNAEIQPMLVMDIHNQHEW
jgi:hypothetical protein